jgi:hypothetical protein
MSFDVLTPFMHNHNSGGSGEIGSSLAVIRNKKATH